MRRRVETLWNSLSGPIKTMTAITALVGVLFTGGWALDERYAQRRDTQRAFQNVEATLIEGQILELDRQLWEMEQQGRATPQDAQWRRGLETKKRLLEQRLRQLRGIP